ncbi:MAG TPA: hypothetical protein VHG08_14800 [Longimicrobium sp.]|nr:hypothetical protein [Longimicrobium sp.]
MRSIRTGTLILLSLGAGLFAGLLVGRELALAAERKVRLAFHERMTRDRPPPWRDTAQWREDSLRLLRDSYALDPREAGRFQALQNCIVRLAFVRGGTEMEMLHVRAETIPYRRLATGWVYSAGGFPAGSSVDVVLPATRCEHIHQLSFGATSVDPPWTAEPDSAAPAPDGAPSDTTGSVEASRRGIIPTGG